MLNNNDIRLDDLNLDNLKIYQYTNGYAFTSDSVLLANFVKTKKSDICVEIGAGSGIISILVNYKTKPKKIYAFEMQQKYCLLAKTNVDYNNMNNIEIVESKIQNYKNFIDFNVDVVFCNPPYYKNQTCKPSEDESIAMCKHESFLPLEELIYCVSKLLKFKGKFYIVYPANRVCELVYKLKQYGLEPKKMFFAQPNTKKEANTVYIECVKGGKEGVKVLPTLVTNNLDGDYVQTIQKLYRDRG